MDVFGDAWRSHAARMAEAWDASVGSDDVVLLPGDLSWATRLDEARADLEWIGRRPGQKVLLRGNHDSWWQSLARVRAALPAGCHALQNDALELDGVVIVGTRGWTAPDDPVAVPADAPIFHREVERLKLSIADADARLDRTLPRVAMLHYPPWIVGREPTAMVPLLEAAGVRACVYGHLHGENHALGLEGLHRGIRFHLVAADAVGFAPRRVAL